jgi:hypothetical protein
MIKFRWRCLLVACSVALSACTGLAPRSPHPLDEKLEGQWYYECRTFLVDDTLPVSVDGHAIYFEGRSHERMDVAVGTDCAAAARIMTMRFEGTYTLGGPVRVKLGNATVEAVRDDEVKQKITYELTPTFASAVGDEPACKLLLGKGVLEGSNPALRQCSVTKDFRELEDRTQRQRTVLYVDHCRLINGDDDGEKDGDGYPTVLDTQSWGVKYCPKE